MVVQVARPDMALEWDAFIDADTPIREHIEAFRQVQWPYIKRQVRTEFGLPEPADEPHWVDSGHAIYWHRVVVSRRLKKTDPETGRPINTMVDVDYGWKPTGRLPANNAGQLVHYLRKGFLLRPPSGTDVEEFEVAVPAEGPKEPVKPGRTFKCTRLHSSNPTANFAYPSWKAYIRHCEHWGETLEEKPPLNVLGSRGKFKGKWFCIWHVAGFETKETAETHCRAHNSLYRSRGVRLLHISTEDMKVEKKQE
jgi:hypothetical protein|tara:strand:+ start:5484 stop:6239 length:756 start_codon:yes stop_codon:yes gene_type:complete